MANVTKGAAKAAGKLKGAAKTLAGYHGEFDARAHEHNLELMMSQHRNSLGLAALTVAGGLCGLWLRQRLVVRGTPV
jgi:hypothetical protein